MMYHHMNSYQPELGRMQQFGQLPNMTMQQCPIQMSPYMQHVQQQMSMPLEQHHGLVPHISLSAKTVSTAPPTMPSPMSLNDYQSNPRTPLQNSPQLHSWNIAHQTVSPPLTLENEKVYNCNFVGQLQGSYEIESPAGCDQVCVIVPDLADDTEQYAIVRRVCSDGEALPDQFIYQEPARFTLCSVDGKIEAVMMKGSNMKHSVKWQKVEDGGFTVWRRKGEVTFNLVHVESLSRRNSIISTASSGVSNVVDSPIIGADGIAMRIRPELLQQQLMQDRRPVLVNTSSCGSYASNDSFPGNQSVQHYGANTHNVQNIAQMDHKQEALFELIKAHCVGNPSLLKKVVHWGMRNAPARRVTREDASNLSVGRIWVTANASVAQGGEIEESLQESLDEIKGAYREVRQGVYKQPEPQASEPGIQHRLLKDIRGLWKIDEHDIETGRWLPCAQEQPDGRWVDLKNDGKVIRVQIVPMIKILETLGEGLVTGNQDVEKSMEFLFTSCNQKKLNSKLKGRNLKHNIANLKVKLEKQYALSFAVQVANTADAIAQELGVFH